VVNIPDQWSFDAATVADGFDDHVREQLPFYDLATKAVVDLTRLHLPEGGHVYDLGASTGNIGRALQPVLDERKAHMHNLEVSPEMCARMNAPGDLLQVDLREFDPEKLPNDEQPDVVISFLTLAFLPVAERIDVLRNWFREVRPGGCLIAVERIRSRGGLSARYLIQAAKLRAGATGTDVTAKEVSIGGVLVPIDPDIFQELLRYANCNVWQFFGFGDFAGYCIEVPETRN
jgi:tRNA (cmo5U34)-methyltransferase